MLGCVCFVCRLDSDVWADGVERLNNTLLFLRPLQRNDSGVYRCEVANSIDLRSRDVRILIQGESHAPQTTPTLMHAPQATPFLVHARPSDRTLSCACPPDRAHFCARPRPLWCMASSCIWVGVTSNFNQFKI